jgi:hypothetical protein
MDLPADVMQGVEHVTEVLVGVKLDDYLSGHLGHGFAARFQPDQADRLQGQRVVEQGQAVRVITQRDSDAPEGHSLPRNLLVALMSMVRRSRCRRVFGA